MISMEKALLLDRRSRALTGLAGWLIFIVVHGLVIMAGMFAAKDFRAQGPSRKSRSSQEPRPADEVEVSADKIAFKLTKPGMTLLLVAFAFYWLYIKFVYPVTVVHL